jgi:hypothetical protein
MYRLIQARLSFKCAEVLVIGLHTKHADLSGAPDRLATFIKQNRHSFDEFDSFSYVTEASFLVYATAILDTFISDTTLFLFLADPARLAEKGQQILLTDALRAPSRSTLINRLASGRVRSIGQESFRKRLRILESKFGLKIELEQHTEEALNHFKDIRNAFVHDQGVYKLYLGDDNQVKAEQKTCPLHPTPISATEVRRSIVTYCHAAGALYRAVARDILRAESDKEVQTRIAAFTRLGTVTDDSDKKSSTGARDGSPSTA